MVTRHPRRLIVLAHTVDAAFDVLEHVPIEEASHAAVVFDEVSYNRVRGFSGYTLIRAKDWKATRLPLFIIAELEDRAVAIEESDA